MKYEQAVEQIKEAALRGDSDVINARHALPSQPRHLVYRMIKQGLIPAVRLAGKILTIETLAAGFFADSIQPACAVQPKAKPVRAKGSRMQQIKDAEAKVLGG